MHDLEFDHLHYVPDDEVNEVAWATDNVELRTVGIDIGSSTSHLMFSLVHLQRLGTALSSRFVVIKRQVMWESPIKLTPYLPDYTIDTDDLAEFFGSCYHLAQVDPDDVDTGAVILTGEAIKRHNARAIADLFSEVSGTFVCASAGHHMECQMAAHGSGAVAMSKATGNTVLNVDIGGGTTKLAVIDKGEILASIAIAAGGRLIVEEKGMGMTRIEGPAQQIAQSLGLPLSLGQALPAEARAKLIDRMVRQIVRMIDRRAPDELSRKLLVTDPWPEALSSRTIDAITFSGGVAEYLYKRETRSFGDLGFDLAEGLRHMLARRKDLPPVWDPGQGIRATVIGAAQFSVQVSGNTILVSRPDDLPVQNLPVIACNFKMDDAIDPAPVTAAVRASLAQSDIDEGSATVALAFPWHGDPSHARLHAVASGITAALPNTLAAGLPIVLLVDGDVGKSLGRVIRNETAPGSHVIALDGVQLKQFDYVDIGRVIELTNAVPVIIKSLLFK
jgi:ethanolamine utilization protein EutA